MARRPPDEDLFAETTMSFGEHLEELRIALSKSLVGLTVGVLIGLGIANYVVSYIQTPLKRALEDHFIDKAVSELHRQYSSRGAEVSPAVEAFIKNKRFVFEQVYVEADEVQRVSQLSSERGGAESALPQGTAAENKEDAPANPPRTEVAILGDGVPAPGDTFILTRAWRPIDTVVKALSAQEAFMIWLKAALVTGLVIASPYIFWEIWAFVAAGLYPHEKRYVHIYLPFSLVLFFCGVALAFYVVFQYVLEFLFRFNKSMNIDPDPRISEWMSFVLMLPLGFGIAFQLPLVMLFLHRIGIFTIKAYLDKWRIAVLVIFVISMLLTPADPMSMLMMALPLTALYFLGVGLCRWMPRHRSPFSEGYEP
jgi:sec-independent protein translocase protein TatC